MSKGRKNDSFMDFRGDINAQLCALVKLTNLEAAYVVSAIRTLDVSRHRNTALPQ